MWWEIRRVNYDLQAGVIIRQPTINDKKKSVDSQRSVFMSRQQPLRNVRHLSVNVTVSLREEKWTTKRVLEGFPSAPSQLNTPQTSRSEFQTIDKDKKRDRPTRSGKKQKTKQETPEKKSRKKMI